MALVFCAGAPGPLLAKCTLVRALLAYVLAAAISVSAAPSWAASGRTTAAELKAAHGAVDAALKLRRHRLDAWQRADRAKETGAADVAHKKRAGVSGALLKDVLREALALDEEATRARSALLAAEAEVARGGAALLELYDALLLERRRAVEALPAHGAARAQAAAVYQQLSAQRDGVRTALLPVLAERSLGALERAGELPRVDLGAHADDDVETLLEKADLARDLEARCLRQAEAVAKRIAELEEEQAVARELSGVVGRSQLFDEEDRRILVLRPAAVNAGTSGTNNNRSTNAPASDAIDVFPNSSPGESAGGRAPAPPSVPSAFAGGDGATSSPAALASPAAGSPPLQLAEQSLGLLPTDAALSGLFTSSGASVEALRALEAKLKAQALMLRDTSQKLKTEAKARAQE
jgi:hypothetical protein